MNTFKHTAVHSAIRQATPCQQQQSDASAGFTEVKRLIEGIGTAFEEFKKTNDARIKAIEEGKSTAEHDAKLAKLSEKLDTLGDAKSRIDDIEKRLNRPDLSDAASADVKAELKAFNLNVVTVKGRSPLSIEDYVGYKDAFNAYLRVNGHIDQLSEAQRKSMFAGADNQGGYFLPPPTVNSIVKKVYDFSLLRQLSSVITIGTNSIEGLTDRDDVTSGWVAELGTRSAATTPVIGKDRIDAFEMYSFPDVSQTLIDDVAFDIEAWLVDKVATSFQTIESTAFAVGTGVGQARGLFSYTTAATADATRTWGQFEHVATGASADFNGTNPADYIIDLISKLKVGYLNNAQFLMNRAVRAKIRKFKEATTNAYMWQPGLAKGVPDTLFGYNVNLDEYVPALAASSLSMAFGDFKAGFQIVDRQGMRMLRDPYTNKPKVGLYCTRRVGSAARDFDAVKFMKFI
jgi:HK97 family phage major capsid protein